MKLWICRDKYGLWLSKTKPFFAHDMWTNNDGTMDRIYSDDLFPEVTSENSPREIELKLIESKGNGQLTSKKYKVLFADLDGTLIDTISGETFPKGIWDMRMKFEVLNKIKELNPDFLLIVTNQGGIEKGFVDENEFQRKSEYVSRAIREYCGCKVHTMYCTTNDKEDVYRKPNIGMLESLCVDYVGDDFEYIKSHSLMIGDASGKPGQFSDSDKRCAENFGIDYLDVEDFLQTIFKEDTK